MTFDEIVAQAMDRLNLTSEDALLRVERFVNKRYRAVTTSIGLVTSRRVVREFTYDGATDIELPEVVVSGMEKIFTIKLVIDADSWKRLDEVTFSDLTYRPARDANPTAFAVKLVGPQEVRIQLDGFPSTDEFTLNVEGLDIAIDLEGSLEPWFPESFHDLLIEGAMSDELRKMEKPQLASIAETNYAQRLSDLRYFLVKSEWVDIIQGKRSEGPFNPFYPGNRSNRFR